MEIMVSVAQALMPVRCKRLLVVTNLRELNTAHSQEWLCYSVVAAQHAAPLQGGIAAYD
jgi:hypothetical protein